MAVNHLIFQGHLVADPEVGTTSSGKAYANFRLAWNKKIRENESKAFIECKTFDERATFIGQWFKKGNEMIAEGELRTEEWTTQDGQRRNKLVLMVTAAHFTGKRQDSQQAPAQAPAAAPAGTPVETDELPF